MNTTNAKVIRKYVRKYIPDHSSGSIYKWLKRFWVSLSAKERYKLKKKLQSGHKLQSNIVRRSGSSTLMLDWSRLIKKKQESGKIRKIYRRENARR